MTQDQSQGQSTPPEFTPTTLLKALGASGIPHNLHEHEAVFTVAEAATASTAILGTHTRNLFLKDKKERMFLVTLLHDTPVDLKKLADLLGVGRLSFGSPDRLWTYLGVTPGSVTPFAILNDRGGRVTLILEEAMMREDLMTAHPLINTMTVSMSPQGLVTMLKNYAITPRIINLSSVAPDSAEPTNQKECAPCSLE